MQSDNYFNLVEFTRRNIFLTGKAGTGKTTFLHNFIKKTQKQYAIVAPTGIAAINAGGVTIHSMFGLPLTTFAPTTDYVDRNEAINIPNLIPHFKYRRDKLKLFRALEILIIDEVSMLRADVLDMIDWALRSARKSQQKFGGVQVLFIGDLFQLPPVVKESSEKLIHYYYPTPFFFSAKALEDNAPLTITLDKVYRQSDAVFLRLLNAIRNSDIDSIDFNLLAERYQPDFTDDSYIHLVSHNYIAQQINQSRLQALKSKAYHYSAVITDEFKEHLYPTDERLVFKKGARVMFIRNDSSEAKQYFNGMLATISSLDEETIMVTTDDTKEEFTLFKEVWENKKYTTDSNHQITEEVVGKFEQFPIKLAWAVTIHKSQGLTFDKVIVDAGRSFTSGQVYVALSRCRTLQGLVLKSQISSSTIKTNEQIIAFHINTEAGEKVEDILEAEKYNYATEKILWALDVARLQSSFEDAATAAAESSILLEEQKETITHIAEKELNEIAEVYRKFALYLTKKTNAFLQTRQGWNEIEERCTGAVQYFYENIFSKTFSPIKKIYAETKGAKGLKGVNEEIKQALQDAEEYLTSLKKLHLLEKKLLQVNESEFSISVKVEKVPTHIISFKLWDEGLTVSQIAEKRNLTVGTIYSHLTKMTAAGVVDLYRLFSPETVLNFEKIYPTKTALTLTEWKNEYPDLEFHELRLLLAHCKYISSKKHS